MFILSWANFGLVELLTWIYLQILSICLISLSRKSNSHFWDRFLFKPKERKWWKIPGGDLLLFFWGGGCGVRKWVGKYELRKGVKKNAWVAAESNDWFGWRQCYMKTQPNFEGHGWLFGGLSIFLFLCLLGGGRVGITPFSVFLVEPKYMSWNGRNQNGEGVRML